MEGSENECRIVLHWKSLDNAQDKLGRKVVDGKSVECLELCLARHYVGCEEKRFTKSFGFRRPSC